MMGYWAALRAGLLLCIAALGVLLGGVLSAAPGQTEQRERGIPEKLIGAWMSNEPVDVDAPGSARIKVIFKEEGVTRVVAWSTIPLVGKVKTVTGPYEVKDNKIVSKAIRGGAAVRYWFEGGQLAIEYTEGQIVRFHRVEDKESG